MEIVPIPVLSGLYVDGRPDVRVALPVNMVPIPSQEGIADGYLSPAEGIQALALGPGVDRGGVVWGDSSGTGGGVHYRVMGTDLVSVTATGAITTIGSVGGSGPVRMDFSFDRLGILSGGLLWYWNNTTLIQVTDVNIPASLIDMVWVDGYWMVTDGTVIAVSTLADPTTFNAASYSGTDRPDPIKALLKVLNEVHVVSRSFIDVFQNVGGTGFPFSRVNNAVITKGAIGTRTACVFDDKVAVLGGGRSASNNEELPSIHLAHNAQSLRISTLEIDRLLTGYTTAQLAAVFVESVVHPGARFLFVHLPDRTIVYDAMASAVVGQPVWHIRTSALQGFSLYKARYITRAHDTWVVGDTSSSAIGTWVHTGSQHYGLPVRWEFSTPMLRNKGVGAALHQLELLALTGAVTIGTNPTIATSYTEDGELFTQDYAIPSGAIGDRAKKLLWLNLGRWNGFRIHRFRGDSASRLSALLINAGISPLRF